MNLRLSLYELMAQHELDSAASRGLLGVAGLDEPPASLDRWLPRGLAVLAAALGGFGVILWIAANWEDFGRFGRFGLLLAFIAATAACAVARPGLRSPFGLLALLGIGGLFAYFGQTYQTGADPWQLFALWAVLGLPLCLGARSDVLWAPWAVVAMTAVSLWTFAHVGHRWSVGPPDFPTHVLACALAMLLVLLLSRAACRFTGAGVWSLRVAATLMVCMVGASAIAGLFQESIAPQFWLGMGVLVLTAMVFSRRQAFDVFALSAVALALDVLVTLWFAHLLIRRDPDVGLLLTGCAAAALLGASVTAILRIWRRHGALQ